MEKTCDTKDNLFGYLAKMTVEKKCLYHTINYAHANVVLNKSLGKF